MWYFSWRIIDEFVVQLLGEKIVLPAVEHTNLQYLNVDAQLFGLMSQAITEAVCPLHAWKQV